MTYDGSVGVYNVLCWQRFLDDVAVDIEHVQTPGASEDWGVRLSYHQHQGGMAYELRGKADLHHRFYLDGVLVGEGTAEEFGETDLYALVNSRWDGCLVSHGVVLDASACQGCYNRVDASVVITDCQRTAWHEAGHVLGYCLSGRRVESVDACQRRTRAETAEETSPDARYRSAVTALAGFHATELVVAIDVLPHVDRSFSLNDTPDGRDYEDALLETREVVAQRLKEAGGSGAEARTPGRAPDEEIAAWRQLFCCARETARLELQQHRQAVEAVALELLRKRCPLPGTPAMCIVMDNIDSARSAALRTVLGIG